VNTRSRGGIRGEGRGKKGRGLQLEATGSAERHIVRLRPVFATDD